eukprot:TRINITY_DN55055_c0_g1_i2.p1 TRINITY_DN55055_c0_g1~~TRINITY_DN55055_c0_g1_i2.p1  ORF type:complete len:177 (+),score=24.55 TRINITY_DN55055_c0_g1_i2:277-807(+)
MNRNRHYFYEVDLKGKLHRLEFDQPGQRFGEIKSTGADWRQVDYFFAHLQANDTGLYEPEYPFMSTRMHEKYFVKCSACPVVFNDLRDGNLRYGATNQQRFDPASLSISAEGYLHHPVQTKAAILPGLIESNTAQLLFEQVEVQEVQHGQMIFTLQWGSDQFEIPTLGNTPDTYEY